MIFIHQKKLFSVLISALMLAGVADAQSELWTLKRCIDYAKENNIQILSQEINVKTNEASLEQARAAQLPTLSFSASAGGSLANASGTASLNNSFGLNSGLAIYQGGKLRNSILQQEIKAKASSLDLEQDKIDMEISVAEAYLQILYNKESLDLNHRAEELSAKQVARAQQMYEAGSISKVDLSQLKSQNASDKYQIVAAENNLEQSRLRLKQLLELGLEQGFEVYFPEIDDAVVGKAIPSVAEVYYTAVECLPQVKSSELDMESAELGVKIARGSYMPSISMSAGVSTGVANMMDGGYFSQLGNKLGESIGINLNLPIFNGKQVRTNVKKAELQSKAAALQDESIKKQLLSTVESVHNDAVSAQQKYFASKAQLEAATESYRLVNEQFNAGIKNIIELMTERNNYINTESQLLQLKYQAVFAEKLLRRYMNEPIEL